MKLRTTLFTVVLFWVFGAAPAMGNGVTLPEARRVVLDNGTVLILNEKHDVPLIGLEAVVRGGAASDPNDKHGLASLLAELLQKGAGERSSAEFAEAVEAVGGNVDASVDLESISVSAEFMASDAALMVELVADLLQRPTLAAAEFSKLRKRSINLIKAAKGSNPGALMPTYSNAFLFADHPYGNPVSGSEATLANIAHDDVLAAYDALLGGDRLIVSVSGDFAADEMSARLTAAFGNWRSAGEPLPDIAAAPPAETNRVLLIDKPGATQSYFRIGNVGVSLNFPERASLDLANTVFGGRFSSMLMTELRVNSGLSYGARSTLRRHAQPGSVFISSFTKTSTTVAALDVALSTLERLRGGGLAAEMIAPARSYILGQFPPQFETAAQLANVFAFLETHHLDRAYFDNYGDDLAVVTSASVAETINNVYPPTDKLVFVILGDAATIRDDVARYGPVTEMSISEPSFHPQAPAP